MVVSVPARWILAGLISIGLQLCCCNFETLFSGCCGGQPDRLDAAAIADAGDHDHATHDHHHHSGGDHDQGAAESHTGDHSKSCAPCDHDGHGGCSCGTHDKMPSQIIKVDLPMAVVAILSASSAFPPALTFSAPRYAELHAVFPPQTSLLQQHCALII